MNDEVRPFGVRTAPIPTRESTSPAEGPRREASAGRIDRRGDRYGRSAGLAPGWSRHVPRVWRSPSAVALVALVAAFWVVVGIRLGPSLLGMKTFAPVDILSTQVPWDDHWLLTTPTNWYGGDTIDFFLPGYQEMFHRLWSGEIPWWSTLSGSGVGLFSSSIIPSLTPGSVVLLFAPTSWAIGAAKLTQLLLAFGGMMLWLRRIGTTWAAGALAGLFYCGSGFFVAWSGWVAQATVAATIPLLFWAIERFLAKRTVPSALAISLVVAWLLLGGFPAVAGHALYAGGVYFLVRLFVQRRSLGARTSLWALLGAAGAVALGGALAAVQLLPTVSGLLDSDLAWRRSQFDAVLPFRSFVSTFFPTIFSPTDDVAQGYRPFNPIEAYAYLGAGAAALAILAVLSGRHHGVRRGVVPVLAFVGILASALVWKHGWWTDWLRDLPVFSGNPVGRLRAMVALTGSALAGVGFNLVFRGDLPSGVRRRLRAGAWATVAVATLATAVLVVRYHDTVDSGQLWLDCALAVGSVVVVAILVSVGPARSQVAPSIRDPGGSTVGDSVIADPGARIGKSRHKALPALLIAFAVISGTQFLVATSYYWPTSDVADFYPQTPGVAALKEATGEGRALIDRGFPGSTAAAYGIRTVTGHNYQAPTWREVLMTLDPEAYTASGYSPTNPHVDVDLTDGFLANPLLDRLSATTVVTAPSTVVPGLIKNLDGTPAGALVNGGAMVAVGSQGRAAGAEFAARSLRGFALQIGEGVGDQRNGIELEIEVRDRSGDVVAVGSSVRPRWVAGWTQIPVAGANLDRASGPLTATLSAHSLAQPNQQVLVGASAAGVDLRLLVPQDDGLSIAYADSQIVVWHRPTALPRVRWATQAIVVPDVRERLTALVDPATPKSAVVLSEPGPVPSGASAQLAVGTETGDEVSIDVAAAGAGYLVLADAIQSGWTVTIDGEPARLVDADHAFGAVYVPQGRHEITFRYNPATMRVGLIVSGSAMVLALALLAAAGYRRRRWTAGRVDPSTAKQADEGDRPDDTRLARCAGTVEYGMSRSYDSPGRAG